MSKKYNNNPLLIIGTAVAFAAGSVYGITVKINKSIDDKIKPSISISDINNDGLDDIILNYPNGSRDIIVGYKTDNRISYKLDR